MDENHPKRRKDKHNPYSISKRDRQYFLSFKDGEGFPYDIEVDKPLYELFNHFELEDLSYLNVWDRHTEHSSLSEDTLNRRALNRNDSIEDVVIETIQKEQLHKAISELPEIQHRRLVLYYFEKFTYKQIAEMEGCTKRAIKFSIDIAIKKLKEKL